MSEVAKTEDADENGQRNRDGNDQRAFPVSEEEQNHDGSEAYGDDRFADDTLDGSANIERLVEKGRDAQALGNRGFVVIEHLLDLVDDFDSGSRTGLVDAHEHAALSIGQNDISLRRKTIAQ